MKISSDSATEFKLYWREEDSHVIWRIGGVLESVDASDSLFMSLGARVAWFGRAIFPLACWSNQPSFYLVGIRCNEVIEFNQIIGDLTLITRPQALDGRHIIRKNEDGDTVSVFTTSVAHVERFINDLWLEIEAYRFGERDEDSE